jgi:hypothetical protein
LIEGQEGGCNPDPCEEEGEGAVDDDTVSVQDCMSSGQMAEELGWLLIGKKELVVERLLFGGGGGRDVGEAVVSTTVATVPSGDVCWASALVESITGIIKMISSLVPDLTVFLDVSFVTWVLKSEGAEIGELLRSKRIDLFSEDSSAIFRYFIGILLFEWCMTVVDVETKVDWQRLCWRTGRHRSRPLGQTKDD